MAHPIKNHGKVFTKALSHTVTSFSSTKFKVVSGSSGEAYAVDLNDDGRATCTCPRQEYIGTLRNGGNNMCSHVQACIKWTLAQEGYSLTPRTGEEDLSGLHRKIVGRGESDNVRFTARKDVKATRRLRNEIVDDRTSAERNDAVIRANAILFGHDPDEAVASLYREEEEYA